MVHRNRLRPTYASVTATLALFIALGGGAYAATALPANSVGPKQIKKNAVERSKLKSNAVDTTKILDNSVTGDDVKESFLDKVPSAATRRPRDACRLHRRARQGQLPGGRRVAPARSAPARRPGAIRASGSSAAASGSTIRRIAWIVDGFPNGGNTAWTARVWQLADNAPVGFTVYAICTSVTAVG